MEKKVSLKSIVKYNGHAVTPNKIVNISFKFNYDELVNYIQSVQMLNENIIVIVKLGDQKPEKVGTFLIKGLNIDGDGEAILKLGSQLDFTESLVINKIASFGKDEMFKILLEATIEVEEEEEKVEEESWDD